MIVTPTEQQLYTKLGQFIVALLAPATPTVVQGQQNRAATPDGPFVVMQFVGRFRLATNVSTYLDPYPSPTPGSNTRRTSVKVMAQVDFYGPEAGDWAQIFSTMWRDDYACDLLAPECQPLVADEPKQISFVDGEDQYLQRWTVTATLQYNPLTSTPQEFAGALAVDLINVDVEYPP